MEERKGCGYKLNKFLVDVLKLESPTIDEYASGLFPNEPETAQAHASYLKSLAAEGEIKIFHAGRDKTGRLIASILTPRDLD